MGLCSAISRLLNPPAPYKIKNVRKEHPQSTDQPQTAPSTKQPQTQRPQTAQPQTAQPLTAPSTKQPQTERPQTAQPPTAQPLTAPPQNAPLLSVPSPTRNKKGRNFEENLLSMGTHVVPWQWKVILSASCSQCRVYSRFVNMMTDNHLGAMYVNLLIYIHYHQKLFGVMV